MRVLLDENLPHSLRQAISGHEVVTTAFAGWAGITNGHLIALAEAAAFDVFVTCDQGIHYQQNLRKHRMAIVMLTAQNWPILQQHLKAIQSAVDRATVGSFEVVECGRFQR